MGKIITLPKPYRKSPPPEFADADMRRRAWARLKEVMDYERERKTGGWRGWRVRWLKPSLIVEAHEIFYYLAGMGEPPASLQERSPKNGNNA